jgi:hypothetical protein
VLVSSGGAAATGLVLGILMALAIGGVKGCTADLDSTATETPSDVPTAVDGGTDSTELGLNVPGVIRTTGRSGQNVALTVSPGPDPQVHAGSP